MKHTHLTAKTGRIMKHACIICKEKFQLSDTEVKMIENGEIRPLDVNICEECADIAAEQWAKEEAMRELRDFNAN